MDNVVITGLVDQCNSPRPTNSFDMINDGFGALQPIDDDVELAYL